MFGHFLFHVLNARMLSFVEKNMKTPTYNIYVNYKQKDWKTGQSPIYFRIIYNRRKAEYRLPVNASKSRKKFVRIPSKFYEGWTSNKIIRIFEKEFYLFLRKFHFFEMLSVKEIRDLLVETVEKKYFNQYSTL